jgi:hypothetical protein
MLLYLASLRTVLYDETNIGYRTTAIRVSFFLVFDYRNIEYRIGAVRLWKSFDSGSDFDSGSALAPDPDNIKHSFPTTKICTKSYLLMSEVSLFPRKLAYYF